MPFVDVIIYSFHYLLDPKVAEQVSATVPLNYTPSLNVVYFPQLGETFLTGLWPVWLIGFT